MSECDSCPGNRQLIETCRDMCGMEMHENKAPWCVMGEHFKRDVCTFAPLLKALPSATEEQIRIATAVLRGEYNCGHCGSLFDLREFGGEEEELCPIHFDEPEAEACNEWTQRDKEA